MLHQQNEIIAERYQITSILGEGGMGSTYSAFDIKKSQSVALKAISLRETKDWKILELFEREAKVLASINHPYIPDYLDYFELDSNEDRRFYLVQELVAGKSLAELVANDWHPSETEVKDIAVQLLNILTYLHSRSPVIIHRDIKPQNIIRRQDNQVYLVDFGAVQDICRYQGDLDKTLVGTLGYMSIEQIQGNAIPASDLYSLGCCLLFLLSHKPPVEFPKTSMKLDFSSQIKVSASFQTWLAKILEPLPDNRFDSAIAAVQDLQNESSSSMITADIANLSKAKRQQVMVSKYKDSLRYTIPLGSYDSNENKKSFSLLSKVSLAIAGLFVVPEITVVGICMWLFYHGSFPKQSKSKKLAPSTSSVAQKYIALEINSEMFCLERTTKIDESGFVKIDRQKGKTTDIRWINCLTRNGESIVIATRQDDLECQYAFGDEYLSKNEAEEIIHQIKKFINSVS